MLLILWSKVIFTVELTQRLKVASPLVQCRNLRSEWNRHTAAQKQCQRSPGRHCHGSAAANAVLRTLENWQELRDLAHYSFFWVVVV